MSDAVTNVAGVGCKRVGWPSHDERPRGFTMVEVVASLGIVVLSLLTLHTTILSSIQHRQRAELHEVLRMQGFDYMQALLALPFGKASDGAASPAQLTELFDADEVLGTVTLKQVETAIAAPGHSFTMSYDGRQVLWRVSVNADLDGDGLAGGFREGRPDLLRLEVFADNRLLFRTIRAADLDNTIKD